MSEAQVKATPRPWHVDNTPDDSVAQLIYDVKGRGVADTSNNSKPEAEQIANAELIVRAVNSHDKLLEALKAAHKLLTIEHFDTSDGLVSRCEEIAKLAEAAIQSAEEQPK